MSERESPRGTEASSVAHDAFSAVGVNAVALVLGYALAVIGPAFLVMVLPFGMFWGYVLLVGYYAVLQLRKGRKRRAILTGALAAIVLIVLAMNLGIA